MSERRAKKERKNEVQPVTRKKNSNVLFNVIITVVILAVVALGVWAVYPTLNNGDQVVEDSLETQTLGEVAEEMGTTAEEILATYEVDESNGFNADSDIIEVTSQMTVDNYAKFEGVTFDEVKAQYRFTDDVTGSMKMIEAQDYMPVDNIVMGTGTDYATFLSAYGLTEEDLPADTLYKDALPILEAAQEKVMEQQMQNQMAQDGVEVGNVDVSVGE